MEYKSLQLEASSQQLLSGIITVAIPENFYYVRKR
jgi:hypothetical protein